MHLSRLWRPRAFLITICAFAFSFVIVLNVMVNQLQNNEAGLQPGSLFVKKQRDSHGVVDLEFEHYVANGNRKIKAANDKVLNDGNNNVRVKLTKRKAIPAVKKLNFKFQKDQEIETSLNDDKNTNDLNNEDDNYSDDINNVVIEDDDNDEDDDDNDEYVDDDINKNNGMTDVKNKENSIFKPKDFLNESKAVFTKPPLRYQEVGKINKKKNGNSKPLPGSNVGVVKFMNSKLITNGIYWSTEAEKIVPKGLTSAEVEAYTQTTQKQKIKSLHPPTWNKCGRPKNGFVILQDGKPMCARYRDPHNKLVLGELLSYYLSRLLEMDNIPAVVLSRLNSTSHWQAVKINSLDWEEGKFVALIQWIPDMDSMRSHVRIPPLIYKSYTSGEPVTEKTIFNSTLKVQEVSELLQWGSMIIFDFLTGNYDRFASMQDAAEKEKKPSIILENIRNLRRSTKTSKLWLIDNESGLLDAYDLLYKGGRSGARFIKFHKDMLQTMCIFQKSIADAIKLLSQTPEPHVLLEKFARKHESLLDKVPKDYSYSLFRTHFSKRLNSVQEWITHCQTLSNR